MHWLPWWAYPAACCVLFGGGCGWLVGYAHRELIELGRWYGRTLAWQRKYRGRGPLRRLARAYRVLWADCARLVSTGRWT